MAREWLRGLSSDDWRTGAINSSPRFFGTDIRFFSSAPELGSYLPLKVGETGEFGKFRMFLREPKEGKRILPILDFSWDRLNDLESAVLRLRLGLLIHEGDNDFKFTGLRFETPEGPGRHDYWHAQPIKGFTPGDIFAERFSCPWHPDTLPTIPVVAQTPLQLLAVMLVALYGVQVLDNELVNMELVAPGRKELKELSAQMKAR